MLTALDIPEAVAYYTVGVRVSQADSDSKRAHEIVTRYLYAGEVVKVEVSDDLETFLVLVRVEGSQERVEQLATETRARLMSGLYPSTEPVYFTARF